MEYDVTVLEKHTDPRGYLIQFLKNSELEGEKKNFGQIYYVTFDKKGVVRANHYHAKKYEWFGVVFGTVRIDLEDIKTKEKKSFTISADDKEFTRLGIGPNVAHAVTSLTDYAILIDYYTGEYSAEDPDTFAYRLGA